MTNKIIPYEKSFASHEKAQFWSDKNDLQPNAVSLNSHKKIWFKCCDCNHEFNTMASNISKGQWCSYCNGHHKLCDNNNCQECYNKSFASHEKAQFWSDKNKLKQRDVFKNSNKKYIFDCICGHDFEITLGNIITGYWCPYCCVPSQKLCDKEDCNQCLEKSFASSEKAQYWSAKNNFTPRQVFKSSHENIIFNCNLCNHEFDIRIACVTSGSWCQYCNGNHKLCDNNSCIKCYNRSFASHEKADYWSKKNKSLPRQVFKSSHEKFYFNCNICKHEFSTHLSSITKGTWCPYCCNPSIKLCEDKDCIQCFEKSFASSDKSKYWSDKNNLQPIQIFKSSGNKYWFNCKNCNHEFDMMLSNISKDNWCPYCSEPCKKLCDNNDCNFCFNKSFASHEKAKYWSDKNDLQPRYVFKGSNTKYIFTCKKKHIFIKSVSSINQGSWCPYCVNKTEQKLYDKLIILYPTLQQQFKVEWCKNKTFLPFDFVIPENKIIIELDGRQHFEQVRNWDDPKKTQENDKYKMKCANDNNYSVIRILQEDVFYDSYDWLSELNNNIKDIIKNKKVENIYMCKDNEYDVFN